MPQAESKRRYFPMVYYVKPRDLGPRRFETQIHKIRDGLALAELGPMLYQAGFEYGGPLLNIPEEVRSRLRAGGRLDQRQPEIQPQDLLLLATRPALDDEPDDERPLLRSGDEYEQAAFAAMRIFFATCDRAEVVLAPRVVLPGRHAHLRTIHFRQNQGGQVRYFDTSAGEIEPPDTRLAVGYLLGLPAICPRGPRLVAAFAMGGTETLWLCHLLRAEMAGEFLKLVETPKPCLRLITFLVPDRAPFPLLGFGPGELHYEVVPADLTEGQLAPTSSNVLNRTPGSMKDPQGR